MCLRYDQTGEILACVLGVCVVRVESIGQGLTTSQRTSLAEGYDLGIPELRVPVAGTCAVEKDPGWRAFVGQDPGSGGAVEARGCC